MHCLQAPPRGMSNSHEAVRCSRKLIICEVALLDCSMLRCHCLQLAAHKCKSSGEHSTDTCRVQNIRGGDGSKGSLGVPGDILAQVQPSTDQVGDGFRVLGVFLIRILEVFLSLLPFVHPHLAHCHAVVQPHLLKKGNLNSPAVKKNRGVEH